MEHAAPEARPLESATQLLAWAACCTPDQLDPMHRLRRGSVTLPSGRQVGGAATGKGPPLAMPTPEYRRLATCPRLPRHATTCLQELCRPPGPRLLACHDMAGGYGEDRFVQVCSPLSQSRTGHRYFEASTCA